MPPQALCFFVHQALHKCFVFIVSHFYKMDKAYALTEHRLDFKSLVVYLLASFELMCFLPLDSIIPLTPKPVFAVLFPLYNLYNEDRGLYKIWMLEMFLSKELETIFLFLYRTFILWYVFAVLHWYIFGNEMLTMFCDYE